MRLFGSLAVLISALSVEAASLIVTPFGDARFGQVEPTVGTLTRHIPLCVAMERPGAYRITARGGGAGGQFSLTGGIRPLDFNVRFSDQRHGDGRSLAAGQSLGGFQSDQMIVGGACQRLNARLAVTLWSAALSSSSSGAYSGTLWLTVSPE